MRTSQNRIVIDYYGIEKLILLASINTETGDEEDIQIYSNSFDIAKKCVGINDIVILKTLEEENKEGFVLKFSNGLRLKVKFEEYLRLHRIVTGVSTISIWEYLKDGNDIEQILQKVPDEFYTWVKKIKQELQNKFLEIMETASLDLEEYLITHDIFTRKEIASHIQSCKYPQVMFKMLDKQNSDQVIWKMIRPEFFKPSKITIDNK